MCEDLSRAPWITHPEYPMPLNALATKEKEMANGWTTEVLVRRTVKDGWHVYTCDELPGLYVAHTNDRVAYNDLPKAIGALVRLDDKVECTVTHKLAYAEFVQRVKLSETAKAKTEIPPLLPT